MYRKIFHGNAARLLEDSAGGFAPVPNNRG